MTIGNNDIVSLYVGYVEGHGGKPRPVLVVNSNKKKLEIYRITTKYQTKSKYIKEQYYKIKEWEKAGLYKPSWVDVGELKRINPDGLDVKKIGTMTAGDRRGLRNQAEMVAQNRIHSVFRKRLSHAVLQELRQFLEDNQIPKELVSVDRIIQSITDIQADLNTDELVKSIRAKGNINFSSIDEQVADFIKENYDSDYLIVKISQKVNSNIIKEKIVDDLSEKLSVTSPYKAVERSYWTSKLNRVESIRDLYKYAKTEDLAGLTEKYIPEWKESIDEDHS